MRQFTNELGNHIGVEVTATADGIRMYIEGPTSCIESIVTRQEAEVLLDELARVLAENTVSN